MTQIRNLIGGFFLLLTTGLQAQSPNWTVNPNAFQYNMTVTASLDVNCVGLTNPSNKLGAFVGGVLRGTANTSNVINGRFITTMSVYSNAVSGETVNFQFYDVATDSIYISVDNVLFQDNAIYGTLNSPFIVKTNNAPTALTISNDSMQENLPSGQVIGSFSTTDLNVGQTHTYSLVSGTGATNNGSFSISGGQLIANFVADFENKTSYSTRVRTTDSQGCTFERVVLVYVKNTNDAPTAIALSNAMIDERNPVNATIGSLTATDQDANETFTFSLVSGAGGADNGKFNIVNSNLRASQSFNFEVQSTFKIRVRVTDKAANTFEDSLSISVNDLNDLPTDIVITKDSIAENQALNSLVGTFSTVDEDAAQTHSYSFNNIAGNDNGSFIVVGNQLRTSAIFDYEGRKEYFIYVQTNDLNGGLFTKLITIKISNTNDAPTDLQLSSSSVNESMPAGTFVAELLTTDQDTGSTFTYSLISGVGSTNNANFYVSNDTLFTNIVLDLNAQASHDIRLRTNDGAGGVFSKAFTIFVKDINNVPTNMVISNNIIPENTPIGAQVATFTTTDADAGDVHTYSLVAGVGDTNNAAFTISANKLMSNTTFNVNLKSNYYIRVQTNDGFGGVFQKDYSFIITNSNDAPTNILLSNNRVYESAPPNTLIGTFTSLDPDSGDTHTYSFVTGTNDNASFALVGNELRSAITYNFEAKSNYFLMVQSNDGKGGTFNKQFNVVIRDTTDGPTDISINNNLVAENSPTKTLIGIFSSTDEDLNDTFTYQLTSGINSTDNGSFQISSDSLFTLAMFDFETRQNYSIRVRSTDASNLFTEKAFTVKVTNANDAPIDINLTNANVSEDATLNTTVGIFTTLDPDTGNTHTYTLVAGVGDADNDDFKISGNALKTDSVYDVNVRTAYTVRVRARDGQGLTYEKVFAITITNANDAPTNISLTPSSINENLPANTLIGKFSSVDADAGDSHIYTFANLSTNDNSSFAIVGDELRSSAIFDYETKPVYFIQIQTSDGNGGTYSRQLFVNVNDTNDIPTDIAMSGNSVKEKQALGEFVGRLSTTDQDAVDTYVYSLVNGTGATDNADFIVRNDSVFSNASFDITLKSQLSIRLRTTDSRNKNVEKVFTVFVQNVNDSPTDITISNASTPENTPINTTIGNFTTTDIDPMQTFTYQLVTGTGSGDNGNFIISGNQLKSNVLLDYNTKRQHSIRVQTRDQGGLLFEKVFTIAVTNSNDAPTDIKLGANSFKENLPASSLIGLFSTTDKDSNDVFSYSFSNQGNNDNASFIISGNELRTGAAFDFEAKNLFVVEVQTRDVIGAVYSRQLTLSVLDSNDAPTNVLISSDSLLEKSPIGTFVTDFTTIDEDAQDNFTYALVPGQGANDNGLFRINGNLLEVDSVLDYNNARTRRVRVETTDKGGRKIQRSFTIRIINQNDIPTNILLSDTSINEVAAIGTRVAVISTLDADLSDTFTYSLVSGSGDNGNASFMINGNELKTNAVFDFETKDSYSIRLRTVDSQGGVFEKIFTIQLTNGNERPTIEKQLFTVEENTDAGAIVGTVLASDLDANEIFTFRIVSTQTDFKVNVFNGELSSSRSFDYESQSTYTINVEVTDLGGLRDTAEITIEVFDQIEGSLPAAGYFSPNNDGYNDTWQIQNVNLYSNYKLIIFSTTGEIVYDRSSNYTNDWDGTYNGDQLPDGVYYYFLQSNTNSADIYKGTITLKR